MSKIIEDLNWRYATKVFDPEKKISAEDFEVLKEALRLTPSSFGLQPWSFVVVEDQATKDKLVEKSWGQKQVGQANYVFVICRPKSFGEKHVDRFVNDIASKRGQSLDDLAGYSKVMKDFLSRKDEKQIAAWAKDQCYIALGNLMTVCAQMRIDCCPMEGFLPSGYTEVLELDSKDLVPVVVAPVGYRAKEDKYAEAKKIRYLQEDLFIHI